MKHQFALYSSTLTELVRGKHRGDPVMLTEPQLVHRLHNVVRLQREDHFILFDQQNYADLIMKKSEKKQCAVVIKEVHTIVPLAPHITVFLPLLKREALSEALYSCVELGANEIQLIKTEKVQRAWNGHKELEHLVNICIAAAEQSKNFSLPLIKAPMPMQDAVSHIPPDRDRVFFDIQGKPVKTLLSDQHATRAINLIIGPEGDLTETEKIMLAQAGFIAYRLTPTILRAQQALVVGLGMLRSS